MDRHISHTQAVFLMVVVALLWSMAGVVTRQLDAAVRFEVTFWRSAFTTLSLVLILPIMRHMARDRSPEAALERSRIGRFLHRHWGLLPESSAFWISGVCWSVMFTAFMLGLTFTSVANVLIIMSLGPLFTALLARVFIGQRLPLRTWLAVVAAGAGIVYMYGSQFMQALAASGDGAASLLAGSLIALCVPMAGAVNWTVVQRSQQHGERMDLVPSVLLGACLSSLAMLPMAQPLVATSSDIAWLALLGLMQQAIPCILCVMCARILTAPEVSLLALLEVVFGIALAWMGAHEVPGPEVLIGGSVVMAALLINELLGWHGRRNLPRIQTLQAGNEP